MMAQPDMRRLRLGDDGELFAAIACETCGRFSAGDNEHCEHCGASFPEAPSLLRMRLEQLRRSDVKKHESARPAVDLSKLGLFVLLLCALLFAVTLAAYLIPSLLSFDWRIP